MADYSIDDMATPSHQEDRETSFEIGSSTSSLSLESYHSSHAGSSSSLVLEEAPNSNGAINSEEEEDDGAISTFSEDTDDEAVYMSDTAAYKQLREISNTHRSMLQLSRRLAYSRAHRRTLTYAPLRRTLAFAILLGAILLTMFLMLRMYLLVTVYWGSGESNAPQEPTGTSHAASGPSHLSAHLKAHMNPPYVAGSVHNAWTTDICDSCGHVHGSGPCKVPRCHSAVAVASGEPEPRITAPVQRVSSWGGWRGLDCN